MRTIEQIVSDNVIALRKARKFTQLQAAEFADIPMRTYQRVESGENYPEKSTLSAIASAYGVELFELFQVPMPPREVTPKEALAIVARSMGEPLAIPSGTAKRELLAREIIELIPKLGDGALDDIAAGVRKEVGEGPLPGPGGTIKRP